MGLDMFAFATHQLPERLTDIRSHDEDEYIYGWRKHGALHDWMEKLYRRKGGKDTFNIDASVVLSEQDLDALQAAILGRLIPPSYSCHSITAQQSDDIGFIRAARRAITSGKVVYYFGSW